MARKPRPNPSEPEVAETDTNEASTPGPILSDLVAEIPTTPTSPAVTITGVSADKVTATYLPDGEDKCNFVAAIVQH